MNVTLITACSSTRQVQPIAKVGNMPTHLTMAEALVWWIAELNKHRKTTITPREQYRGLGFMTLAKILALEGLEVESRIVTGGQGLLTLDEEIVPYDFTAAKNEPENIHQKVTSEPFVQTVWWSMINQTRYGTSHPVADLIDSSDAPVIISMSKIFLRYISDDILTARGIDRVRIMLPASSVGSVPQQLRPWIIPYDRGSIAHVPGNRNDGSHRAAYVLLKAAQEDPNLLSTDISLLTPMFQGEKRGSSIHGVSEDTIRTYLKERPELLDLEPEEAYSVVRKALGTFGGKMYFRGIFRAIKGTTINVPEDTEAHERAKNALLDLGLSTAQNSSSEDEALAGIQQFIQALKEVAPNAAFSAAQICTWASNFYNGENPPTLLESPNKLTYLLKANTEVLGIITHDNGKSYSLKPA